MTVGVRNLTWGAVLLLLSGCAPANPRPDAPMPADEPGREAAELHARCSAVGEEEAMGCYDAGLQAIMHERGIPAAMSVLGRLSEMDTEIRREGHMYAHSLGLAAYSGADSVSSTFRQCLPTFQSGCYHGVIQGYFAEMAGSDGGNGLSEQVVNDLCQDYRDSSEGDWLLFQCVHGMGHGLSQVSNHDLKRTLAGCDLLHSGWEREGCYGGAFMENIMEAVAPHHAVGRPGETMDHAAMGHTGMDHAGMDHSGMDAAPAAAPKLIDPADPLYPCSALAEKYLHACYQMQTSAMLQLNGGDIPAAARTCDQVALAHRAECYQSLGRDVSAYTLQDFQRAATLCSSGDPLFQPWCHVGFVKNVIDLGADYRQGVAYCRSLVGVEVKKACYRAVGEEIASLTADDTRRAAACDDAEWAFRDTCGRAAGLRKQ